MPRADDQSSPRNQIDAHVGARLREYRRAHGLSLLHAAEILGVSQQQLSRLELGHKRVLASQLYVLAQAYGASIDEFFEGYKPPDEELQRIKDVLRARGINRDGPDASAREDEVLAAFEAMPVDVRGALNQLLLALRRHGKASSDSPDTP